MNDPSTATLARMLLLIAGPSAVVSFGLCYLMRVLAPALGYMDRPGGRKSHPRAMPMGGGVAVVLTVIALIAAGIAAVLSDVYASFPAFDWLAVHREGLALRLHQLAGVLFCGLILLVLGVFDDVKDLGPRFKLLVQFLLAGLVVFGFDVQATVFLPAPMLGSLLTVLWIVVITNAFNFLDNADGLASGVALICTAVLIAVAVGSGQIFVSAYLACFAGAIIGFLLHNFPPARIYLGDAGSQPIGFLLAVGTILTTYYQEQSPDQLRTAVFIPLIIMAIPLYDFFSVIAVRLRESKSRFVGDHRHFSHRLLQRGLRVRDVVLTIYLACGATAVGAIVLQQVAWPYAMLIFLQTLCIVAIIGILEYQPKK